MEKWLTIICEANTSESTERIRFPLRKHMASISWRSIVVKASHVRRSGEQVPFILEWLTASKHPLNGFHYENLHISLHKPSPDFCFYLQENLRATAECFTLKIAIDGSSEQDSSGSSNVLAFVYLLCFINHHQCVLRESSRVINNKKKPNEKLKSRQRTFQCDNKFKTELTGIAKEKSSREIDGEILK